MLVSKLKEYFEEHHIPYHSIRHLPAYTAQETAATMHVSGREFAKTVIVKIDGQMTMIVLPANSRVDCDSLREFFYAKEVRLANETEFRTHFPDCEPGAMPPFGNLYQMDVLVAQPLTQDTSIVFNAGSHDEAVEISYRDFDELVHPVVMNLTR